MKITAQVDPVAGNSTSNAELTGPNASLTVKAMLIGQDVYLGMLVFTTLAGILMGLLGDKLRGRDVAIGATLAFSLALGSLFQSMAHSSGVLFQNAVSAQQQQNTLSQAASNMGVMQIYSVDTMADAASTVSISSATCSNAPRTTASVTGSMADVRFAVFMTGPR